VCDPIANRGKSIPKKDLILVFSDEFNTEGREFGVTKDDPKWTAEDMYYFPTGDIEVYKPEQATTYSEYEVILACACAWPTCLTL
jgi:Beta-glucan synthesis-associated protein SKN1/KRE6/Sbg1